LPSGGGFDNPSISGRGLVGEISINHHFCGAVGKHQSATSDLVVEHLEIWEWNGKYGVSQILDVQIITSTSTIQISGKASGENNTRQTPHKSASGHDPRTSWCNVTILKNDGVRQWEG